MILRFLMKKLFHIIKRRKAQEPPLSQKKNWLKHHLRKLWQKSPQKEKRQHLVTGQMKTFLNVVTSLFQKEALRTPIEKVIERGEKRWKPLMLL